MKDINISHKVKVYNRSGNSSTSPSSVAPDVKKLDNTM